MTFIAGPVAAWATDRALRILRAMWAAPLYCATDSMPGLPFCEAHAKLAYPAVKRRIDRGR